MACVYKSARKVKVFQINWCCVIISSWFVCFVLCMYDNRRKKKRKENKTNIWRAKQEGKHFILKILVAQENGIDEVNATQVAVGVIPENLFLFVYSRGWIVFIVTT